MQTKRNNGKEKNVREEKSKMENERICPNTQRKEERKEGKRKVINGSKIRKIV